MKVILSIIIAITTILLVISAPSSVYAENVPEWVKNSAGWWADGVVSDGEFISGIEFLIKNNIIVVSSTQVSSDSEDSVPEWVKNSAGWWADGVVSDGEFVNSIQHLIKTGIISVSLTPETKQSTSIQSSNDSKLSALEDVLENCSEITKAYDRLNCERSAKFNITAYDYKNNSQSYLVGPITFYWPGFEMDGNSFEITSTGQAMLRLRILVENTGSDQQESLFCTGPAICNYDVWDGKKAYKYSGMDFTNGQVILKPGESKIFNMFFGPNIGGGGTTFEYNSVNDYYFRINEPYGNSSIPLNLK